MSDQDFIPATSAVTQAKKSDRQIRLGDFCG